MPIRSNPLAAINQSQSIADAITNVGQTFSPVNTMQMGLLQAKQREIDAKIANDATELKLKTPVYAGQAANQQAQAGMHDQQASKIANEIKLLQGHQADLRNQGGAISRTYNVDPQVGEDIATISRGSGNPLAGNAQLVPNIQNSIAGMTVVRNANDPATVAAAQNLRGNPMKMNEVAGPQQLADVMATAHNNKIAEEQAKIKNGTTKNPFQTPGALGRADKDTGVLESAFDRQFKGASPEIKSQAVNHAQELFQQGKAPNADTALAQSVAELFGGMVDNPDKHWYNPMSWGDPSKVPAHAAASVQAAPAPAPQTAAPAANPNAAAILAQARQAIQSGKDANAVRARLRQMGVDDSGL